MKCKGVCPFAYMDSSEKFEETKQPPENVFWSKLNMRDISDQD